MNYLTNYYKNLSEQLQEKVNHLTNLLEAKQGFRTDAEKQYRKEKQLENLSTKPIEDIQKEMDFHNEVMGTTDYQQNLLGARTPSRGYYRYNLYQVIKSQNRMKLLDDELKRRKDMTPDNFDSPKDADKIGSTEEVVQAQQRKI